MTIGELVRKAVKQHVFQGHWETARYILENHGHLRGGTEDIPKIVQEVQDDVSLRCKTKILDSIWQIIKGDVYKESVKGLGKWYKDLMEKEKQDDDIDIGTPAVA